jgi:cyanate permease
MERRGIFWAVSMLVLVVLAYVVPYTLLSGVDAWYGSFLFWTLFGAVAIAANVLITASWRD